MANTLIPIQTYTLTSSASSVAFSNIPQNYTDLKLAVSARSDRSAARGYVTVYFNGVFTNQTARRLWGDGSSVSTTSESNNWSFIISGASQTATTFSNTEIHVPNYTSGSAKSFNIDSGQEANETAAYAILTASSTTNTAAITSITVAQTTADNFVSGSTFTLYGVSNGVKATGGTVTVAGGYAYHTFTSTGSFLPNQKIKSAEVLCVAGGGGGGGPAASGGGGAGGVLYTSGSIFNAGQTYTALVGSGGAQSASGSNSVFYSLTSIGGGKGGQEVLAGTLGGSGGGGGQGSQAGGAGTSGQGYAGGTSNSGTTTSTRKCSGGGGAGGAGGNATSTVNGYGGIGTIAYKLWADTTGTGDNGYYAGGGGGGAADGNGSADVVGNEAGWGGLGGGGYSSGTGSTAGSAGTANTGGGGAGGSTTSGVSNGAGGAGGSGLVIVRYPLS